VLTLESEGGPQGHGGGDFGVMRAFAALVRDNDWRNVSTSAAASAQGHSMAFAAEASRLERRTISIPDFHEGLRPEPSAPVLDDLPKG
jgi:hypothetical protein